MQALSAIVATDDIRPQHYAAPGEGVLQLAGAVTVGAELAACFALPINNASLPPAPVPDALLATPLNKKVPTAVLDALGHSCGGNFDTSASTSTSTRAARACTTSCPRARAQSHNTVPARRQQHGAARPDDEPPAIDTPPLSDDPDALLGSSTTS